MTIGLRTSWLQYPVETFTSPYKITSQRRDSVDDSTFGTLNDSTLPPARQSLIRLQFPDGTIDLFHFACMVHAMRCTGGHQRLRDFILSQKL